MVCAPHDQGSYPYPGNQPEQVKRKSQNHRIYTVPKWHGKTNGNKGNQSNKDRSPGGFFHCAPLSERMVKKYLPAARVCQVGRKSARINCVALAARARHCGKSFSLSGGLWRVVAGFRGLWQTQQQARRPAAKQQQAASNKPQAKSKKGALVAVDFVPTSATIASLMSVLSSRFSVPSRLAGSGFRPSTTQDGLCGLPAAQAASCPQTGSTSAVRDRCRRHPDSCRRQNAAATPAPPPSRQ